MKYQDSYQHARAQFDQVMVAAAIAIAWSATMALLFDAEPWTLEFFIAFFVGLFSGLASALFALLILDDLNNYKIADQIAKVEEQRQREEELALRKAIFDQRNDIRAILLFLLSSNGGAQASTKNNASYDTYIHNIW